MTTPAIQARAVLTQSATTEFVHVYQNIKAIHTVDVGLNVS